MVVFFAGGTGHPYFSTDMATVLMAIEINADIVLMHDGARPFVTEKIIEDTINAVFEFGAAVPGVTPTDTQKQIDETKQKSVISSDSTAFNIDDAMPSREDFIRDPNLYKKAVKKWGMSKVDQIIVKG